MLERKIVYHLIVVDDIEKLSRYMEKYFLSVVMWRLKMQLKYVLLNKGQRVQLQNIIEN